MEIPCEECISLAICRHKQLIVCDKLLKHIREINVKKVLPKVVAVHSEDRECASTV